MDIKEKVKLPKKVVGEDINVMNDDYLRTNEEFIANIKLIYLNNIEWDLVKNVDKSEELTSIMRNFLVPLSYKIIYLFPFDDILLNQMNALNPNTFNFNDYCANGQRFRDTVLKEDYEIFYQQLEKFELKLNDNIKQFTASNSTQMTFYQSSCTQKDYSLLSKLALSIISLPYSNAEVKRMFSQLKLCRIFKEML